MSDISPISCTTCTSVAPTTKEKEAVVLNAQTDLQPNTADRVEISAMAHMLSQLNNTADVRTDKVAAIRDAIQNGTYDMSNKLDIAVNRLLESILAEV